MDVLRYIAMDREPAALPVGSAALALEAKTDVWDTVLEFGTYQHVTVDGKPVDQLFDASRAQAMLDDFEQHPESDVFYDKKHVVVDEVPGTEGEALSAYRKRLLEWARGDGHALAWGDALVMVVGAEVRRYVPHFTAPLAPPSYEKICKDQGRRAPDGVYLRRSELTELGAGPLGIRAFRYTSPFFVSQRDGDRLLCLTATNDPRMRGAALARFEREAGRLVAMTRTASVPQEKRMPFDKEMMARIGMEDGDSEAAKVEKMAKYIRKMEDDSKAAEKDKAEAMGRVQKMEDELQGMRRKMEEAEKGKPFGGKETKEEEKAEEKKKEAMQAMQRELQRLREKVEVLEPAASELKGLRDTIAMERKVREDREAAERKAGAGVRAADLIAMGRVKHDQKGDLEKTTAWLTERLQKPDADAFEADLPAEGTFQVSERIALQRMTQGGTGIGQPDPDAGAGATADSRMDAAISKEIEKAKAAGKEISPYVAMERVRASNPSLYTEYHRAAGGR